MTQARIRAGKLWGKAAKRKLEAIPAPPPATHRRERAELAQSPRLTVQNAVKRALQPLSGGGRLAAPVGSVWHQHLILIEKTEDERIRRKSFGEVRFIPMRNDCISDSIVLY